MSMTAIELGKGEVTQQDEEFLKSEQLFKENAVLKNCKIPKISPTAKACRMEYSIVLVLTCTSCVILTKSLVFFLLVLLPLLDITFF